MIENEAIFKTKSALKSVEREHRNTINSNIEKYNASLQSGKSQFDDNNLVKERAKNIKWRALETLDQQLEEFEMHFTNRGGKVIWAQNSQEALDEILKICLEKNCRKIVKSKSAVTDEIQLNPFLKEHNIESIETDLGAYIQQLDEEPAYHFTMPAMHKTRQEVANLFADKLSWPPQLSPHEITLYTREKLRDNFKNAEIGITGANFIISDIGAVAISENEGNIRLTTAWPKTHIVIVGIEKMIPTLTDLALMWPLLSTYGSGQKVTVYNNIISGPRQKGETDGPNEMYVILLDNNRSRVLGNPVQRESLYCIKCGACLNACPVFKNIGGHSYGTTYTGPIGSVITPNLTSMEEHKHLSYASTLCGACTDVCPVKINLHELLINNRKVSVEEGLTSFSDKIARKIWKVASLKRSWMNKGNTILKSKMVNLFYKQWNQYHTPIHFAPKTFNQLWSERFNGDESK